MSIRNAGFSLIELLVVLLIVGLALGTVGLAAGSAHPSRGQSLALQQLAGEIELELLQAQVDGRNRGLFFHPIARGEWAWSWYRLTQAEWRPTATTREKTHAAVLHGAAAPVLKVSGRYLDLAGRDRLALWAEATPLPDVVLYGSGEATPFELVLQTEASGDKQLRLCADALGRVVVEAALAGSGCGEVQR